MELIIIIIYVITYIMPKCKNDPDSTYTGDEPSPKGRGFCAHAVKANIVMKGKDGNNWIVKEVSNGSKRWVKVSESTNKSNDEKTTKRHDEKTTKRHDEKTTKMIAIFNDLLKLKKIDYEQVKKLHKVLEYFDEIKYDYRGQLYTKIVSGKKLNKGSFEVTSGKVIVSDPSYDFVSDPKSNWPINFTSPALNGTWTGYIYDWIVKRPNIMVVHHNDYDIGNAKVTYKWGPTVAVDVGIMSVVDFSKYPKREEEEDQLDWCEENIFPVAKPAGKINGGYVSSSGWGDGSYDTLLGYTKIGDKNVLVSVIIYFML
jgi:hypothetical protein